MQLEMFDALDAEVAAVKAVADAEHAAALAIAREASLQPVECPDCGEMSPNSYLLSTNHAKYFNGMCQLHYAHNSWAQFTEPGYPSERAIASREWLTEHGFPVDARWSM